ncbi:HdeD family acid-resistance protein [Agromyces sp. NPDC058104]|uniref:HdeD family acid-resistance protein n=1 Tax=Agromyces sp. NPDC058104 TaxID=3346342 RepID=UPI0036DE3CB9
MATARDASPERPQYWVVPVVRGLLAVVPAVVITFSPNHSPELGLLVFGIWAVVSGLVVGALSLRLLVGRGIRSLFAINAVVTVVAGLLALSVPGGLPFLLYLVSVWAAVTGFVELYAGLRSRGRTAAARDWIAVGAFTAVLAVVFLLLPPDAVTAVGLLGGYLVILGVFLVIGGLSLKWAANQTADGPAAAGAEQQS